MIKFQCECGQFYEVEGWRGGRTFVCPYCGKEQTVPEESEEEARQGTE